MTGTLSGALAVRKIPNHPDRVQSDIEGDIENVDGVMRITRIRVHYRLKIPAGTRDRAQRALDTHQVKCPAAMSVKGSIDIETSADIEEI
ncbi:MAG: OsmC family protein [Acidobacteriia bacterium]|nr:OsmC family protein [Terriglobia bacterium]MYB51354.1 OsmC family protein [Terriglobia bacterium]MYC68176.1 OsmC family protein [Terriglobia bacterium]MYG03534.1 OsmC family protein [Terriglobia bacterium]MYK12262.1 OsmC family protein [Terriglobia bacterium]